MKPAVRMVRFVRVLLLYEQGYSLQQIGDTMGVSRQRVHQLKRQAEKLRRRNLLVSEQGDTRP